MIDVAQAHTAEAGVTNATFLKGLIEKVPLPDTSVDAVISNCVICLAPGKDTRVHPRSPASCDLAGGWP